MSNQATAKGALLTTGVLVLGAGSSLLLTERWPVALLFVFVGTGLLFAREYLKEN